jgi:hypothetical protein
MHRPWITKFGLFVEEDIVEMINKKSLNEIYVLRLISYNVDHIIFRKFIHNYAKQELTGRTITNCNQDEENISMDDYV